MTEKPVLIIPPGNHWRFMRQRPHQLAIELSKMGYKVIFGEDLISLSRSIFYPATGPYIRDTEYHNLKICYNVYRYAMEHSEDSTFIMLASSGPGHTWSDRLGYRDEGGVLHSMIYDELDNFPPHERSARVACIKADRIIYSAKSLEKVLKQRRAQFPEITEKEFFISNACEFEHWNLPLKTDEQFEPPLKIFYFGAFALWLNFEYILEVVRNLPQCEFWFIGARFDYVASVKPYVDVLLALPNVVALPHIPYDDLPFFAQSADAFWIPFDVTGRKIDSGNLVYPVSLVTQHTNPIKFWEYLAIGRPIVFTPMDALTGFLSTLENKDDYCMTCAPTAQDAIKAFLEYIDYMNLSRVNTSALRHKDLARDHTWQHSAEKLNDVICDLLSTDLSKEREERKEIAKNRQKDPSLRPDFIEIHEPTEPKDLL